jgi:hypothetical protein
MRRAGAGLIVAVLALAGCKSADSKSGDDRAAGRTRKDKDKDKDPAKSPTWLDPLVGLPGAGTDIPKGTGAAAKDPQLAAQERLSGYVRDAEGRPARGVYVDVKEVGAPAPFPTGVYTNDAGYFESPAKPGKTYDLRAEATLDGRKLVGVVQTPVPNTRLDIRLRDDLAAGGTFPPPPRPSDGVVDAVPKADGGSWAPGGPVNGVPPASIGGSAAPVAPRPPSGGGPVPPPDGSLFPSAPGFGTKPENVAGDPRDPLRGPPANIPGTGGAPPVPPLPPALPPTFGPTGGGRSSSNAAAPGKFALVDALERPWDFSAVKPGTLVLVEFMDTTSKPCTEFVPVLKDLQSRYGADGLQLAGVVCDPKSLKDRTALAAKFSTDNNLNYALYVEPGTAGSVRDRFRIERYPHAVLLDSTGKLLWSGHPGYRAELEAAIKQNLAK